MPIVQPRTTLATHAVRNQATPLADVNLYSGDRLLSGLARGAGLAAKDNMFAAFGARAGSEEAQHWSELANRQGPQLKAFDRFGHRIDEVEYHPAYHSLLSLGMEAGVCSIGWTGGATGHRQHAVMLALMTAADPGACCPISMRYASVAALKHEPELAAAWTPKLTAARYDQRCLPYAEKHGLSAGMAMTEKQGGSDVRANTTRADEQQDGSFRLTGHKWFCSAPMSDAFLTLAKINGDDAALTCFLAPKWRPDGTRNSIEIQRLKDKMGDRSNASSEIEYREAFAWRVGPAGRGVATIIDMVSHTRLDCIAGSAAIIRFALSNAVWHCQRRSVFGKHLAEQPLMRAVIADLALESAASLALMLRVAELFDAGAEDIEAARLARVLTPIAKYWVCKRAPAAVGEALECLGGAGFVEESPLPKLFRQSPLNGIWEGSGNVMALDVARALSREPAALQALADELALSGRSAALLPQAAASEGLMRRFTEQAAVLAAAAALNRYGQGEIASLWLRERLDRPHHSFGATDFSAAEAARLMELAAIVA